MTTPPAPSNRLPGVTLQSMLEALLAAHGWAGLYERLPLRCFESDPSVASSLKLLRRTPWARARLEQLHLALLEAAAAARPVVAPFGSWPSEITTARIVGETVRLGQPQLLDGDVFWLEGRPQQQGRSALVRCDALGRISELLPAPWNVRDTVHEYGGGAYTVGRRAAFFVHHADQQIWRLRPGEAPQPLTDEPGTRHADLWIDAPRKRLICVREDHRPAGEARNTLVAIDLAHGRASELAAGHDFFASPCVSPDGRWLAWLTWDHPDMPWDATQLWCAEWLADGRLGPPRALAGGPDESIFQPSWSPQGELHFVSDRTGWWNLYVWRDDRAQPLHARDAEFGVPQWAFGLSTYGHTGDGRIVCSYLEGGRSHLAVLDGTTGRLAPLASDCCEIDALQVGADCAVFIGTWADRPSAIVRIDLGSGEQRVLRASSRTAPDPATVSRAEPIEFVTADGATGHAAFYPPTHPTHRGPSAERAPLLVVTHGGPTGAAHPGFQWSIQYWTSRGLAVVDVDYAGSSGYGRAYRQRLNGRWGVADVDDCIAAARHLIARGDVDATRVGIRGASAGGYTTLCALTFRDFFRVGASHYGIGDLEALVRDTHKFESRYLDRLIGPYPQEAARYRERSPVHHTDRLSSPMILFQGAQDRAVPPAQAQAMFEAVRAKGLPVAFLLFEGEEHGFRRAENIRRAYEAELAFYGRILGFVPADRIEPLTIANLPAP